MALHFFCPGLTFHHSDRTAGINEKLQNNTVQTTQCEIYMHEFCTTVAVQFRFLFNSTSLAHFYFGIKVSECFVCNYLTKRLRAPSKTQYNLTLTSVPPPSTTSRSWPFATPPLGVRGGVYNASSRGRRQPLESDFKLKTSELLFLLRRKCAFSDIWPTSCAVFLLLHTDNTTLIFVLWDFLRPFSFFFVHLSVHSFFLLPSALFFVRSSFSNFLVWVIFYLQSLPCYPSATYSFLLFLQ